MTENPRIVVVGSVTSSQRTLDGLRRHGASVVGALGLDPSVSRGVSGYVDLAAHARGHGLDAATFVAVNEAAVVERVRAWAPDLLFVVGLSQLVRAELLALPRVATVGFHPTALPVGRGRAPLAWLVLGVVPAAATFFAIDEGVDAGPILVQEPFEVGPDDYASDAERSMLEAIDRAMARWAPALVRGEWAPVAQDESRATYMGKRGPEDGRLDWTRPARELYALVRASSHPHPGAFAHAGGRLVRVWRAEPSCAPYRGVVGRVLHVDDDGAALVQTGDGVLRLTEVADDDGGRVRLRVGSHLGLDTHDEVNVLRRKVEALESEIAELRRAASAAPAGGAA